MEVELRMDQWQPNADLAEDRFAFTPPDNAEQVDSFFNQQQSSSGGNEHALVGKQAPGFTLSQLGGGKVDLASHEGENIVILDFWATWCGPCVKAMPIVEKVADEYADQGVVLYAVNLRESKDKIRGFLDEHELDVNVLLDKDGRVAQKYQASSIPQTVIIDTDGSVQAVHVGLLPDLESKLSSELEQLLAGNKLTE
jgi:thiol-disulfide isomerase/thioredoxin